ncbi:hypothetical protein ABXS75_11860 [Roseburia hominis]
MKVKDISYGIGIPVDIIVNRLRTHYDSFSQIPEELLDHEVDRMGIFKEELYIYVI